MIDAALSSVLHASHAQLGPDPAVNSVPRKLFQSPGLVESSSDSVMLPLLYPAAWHLICVGLDLVEEEYTEPV